MSSLEATDCEKALIEALNPWPLTNEEAWGIVRSHLGDLDLRHRVYRKAAEQAEAKLARIHTIVLNDGRVWSNPEHSLREIEAILAEQDKEKA